MNSLPALNTSAEPAGSSADWKPPSAWRKALSQVTKSTFFEKPVYKDIDDTDTVTGKEVGDFIQTFPTNSSASCTKDLPNHGSCTFATNDDHVRVEWEYANSQYPVKTVDSSKLDPNRVDSVVFGAGIVKNPDGTLDVHIGHNEGGWKRVSKNYGEEVYVSAMSAVSGRSRPIKVTVKSSGPALQSDKDITTAGSFVRFGAQERRTESSNGDKNSTGGTQIETFFQKHVEQGRPADARSGTRVKCAPSPCRSNWP